jgi:hypothetical protein
MLNVIVLQARSKMWEAGIGCLPGPSVCASRICDPHSMSLAWARCSGRCSRGRKSYACGITATTVITSRRCFLTGRRCSLPWTFSTALWWKKNLHAYQRRKNCLASWIPCSGHYVAADRFFERAFRGPAAFAAEASTNPGRLRIVTFLLSTMHTNGRARSTGRDTLSGCSPAISADTFSFSITQTARYPQHGLRPSGRMLADASLPLEVLLIGPSEVMHVSGAGRCRGTEPFLGKCAAGRSNKRLEQTSGRKASSTPARSLCAVLDRL